MAKIKNTTSLTMTPDLNGKSTVFCGQPFTYKSKKAQKVNGGYMLEIDREQDPIKDTKKEHPFLFEVTRKEKLDWFDKELIGDTKKRTAERNEVDTMSKVAILAGFIALIAVILYAGVVVDAFIGLIEIGI